MKHQHATWVQRWLPRLLWATAAAPVLAWWARRSLRGDDALIAVTALAGAVLVVASRKQSTAPQNGWYAAAGAMGVYGIGAASSVPATLLGLPLVAGLVLLPGPWRRGNVPNPAVAGLLVLALPAVMMLELYFGYPLRLVASISAEAVLRAAGIPLTREGMLLTLPGCPVWVDAPCSGIRMLWGGLWLALVLCGLGGLGWWRTAAAAGVAVVAVVAANGLRVTFEGEVLHEGTLRADEAAFATRFPGKVGRFACGEKTVIIRWATRPSHRVHSAGDCLRAAGWSIQPQPLAADPMGIGGAWGVFHCVRDGVVLRVRERCAAPDGQTWPDVPSWFWAAWCGRTAGPWQIVTVAVREPPHNSQ